MTAWLAQIEGASVAAVEAGTPPVIWMWLVFTAMIGACVGSFLNVVVYRLPEGLSVVKPASRCPKCGHGLAWYDNVPVFGWMWLRGKCRYCSNPISIQYPLVEAFVALLFGGWFYICYVTGLRPDFAGPGLGETVGPLVVSLFLIGALIAATIIDARYYIIPLEIPWWATGVAAVVLPLSVWMMPWSVETVVVPSGVDAKGRVVSREDRLEFVRPVYRDSAGVQWALQKVGGDRVEVSSAPLVSPGASVVAFGGLIGLGLAFGLLKKGVLPLSFHEDDMEPAQSEDGAVEEAMDDPESWAVHPHPRREVLKELLYLSLPILGIALGGWIGVGVADMPTPWRVLGGVGVGYLVGGGVVWAIRIFGTLGFGKEAMGLGDVHLMAAVGAVAGWEVAVAAFFVAPFFGLAWALGSEGVSRVLKRKVKVIPYGPHLAVASLGVMVFREPLLDAFRVYVSGGG
ncbi:MAG: prepilin peptidase [Planctomycetota bacterium]